jgi:hypothetical protein
MRLASIIVNSKGKQKLVVDNERLDIELYFKNNKIYDLHLYSDENEDGTFSPLITVRDWRK